MPDDSFTVPSTARRRMDVKVPRRDIEDGPDTDRNSMGMDMDIDTDNDTDIHHAVRVTEDGHRVKDLIDVLKMPLYDLRYMLELYPAVGKKKTDNILSTRLFNLKLDLKNA